MGHQACLTCWQPVRPGFSLAPQTPCTIGSTRYGENVDEVNANPDWLCPLCRDICNCSFHRSKRGWAPTGTLYRHAIAEGEPQAGRKLLTAPVPARGWFDYMDGASVQEFPGANKRMCGGLSLMCPTCPPPPPAGYKSVAHYLVLNNLSDEAKPVALERGLCPPELAGGLVIPD